MDNSNPDFIIQPSSKDALVRDGSGLSGVNPSPQQTITLTLTSPPGAHGGSSLSQHSASSGGPTPLIVSGLPSGSGLGISQQGTSVTGPHGQGPSSQSYVMAGAPGGGQPLIVSATTMLPTSGIVSGSIPTHHDRSTIYGSQASQSITAKSYVMSTGGGHDSGDESVPVSIHVSGGGMGGTHDPGPSSADSHTSGQTERLKVEDALNYLDQVKYKFGNQPQVYNDFLDIMKEFKSQSIDTPGVISRVSNLFRGHPELIVGFNTFLPPGYKIEVQTHERGSQISYRVDGVTSYVVTNMPAGLPTVQPTHTPLPQVLPPAPQIIQHTGGSASVQIRSLPAHSASVSNVGMGISNGSISPPLTPSVSLGTGFDAMEPSSSAFTHSFSSPFVQNAFPSLQSQPVQFNHAINYVNKIKNRFCGQPDKYKQFLDILHSYQKDQRNIKEGLPGKNLSEHEVYSQVAKIFENQEDLLAEFGQFLPESNPTLLETKPLNEPPKKPIKVTPREYVLPTAQPAIARSAHGQQSTVPKRGAAPPPAHSLAKKPKLSAPYKEVPFAEAARYGTLQDYAFFDKCRTMLKHQHVFDNFIRCLYLFNEEVLSRQELLTIVQPFFSKAPEMYSWLKEFVNHRREESGPAFEAVTHAVLKQERANVPEETVLEIGEEYFSTCKRLGASYCALPKNHVPARATGKTVLCKEVLNDVWVSFPTWSEDSTFVTSRKTQYEEYICRCEDERFELDVIIEANADTIRTFEAVARRMARMSQEELLNFELDEYLGGTSEVIHQRSVRRVYGDKAADIIEGLKRQPYIVIPIVLKRLKLKEEEWRESQRSFNKIWREQVERFYLKSLDHQGITFKQSDIRMLRSKALVTEIETIYDERHDQDTGELDPTAASGTPHLVFQYHDRAMLDEACNLLLHHVRRLSGIQNEDKRRIKQLLKHFIPDLFKHTRMELSDDETEQGPSSETREEDKNKSPVEGMANGGAGKGNGGKRGGGKRGGGKNKKEDDEDKAEGGSSSKPSDESRRTAYKRALQKQAETARSRKRSGSTGKETGRGGGKANSGGKNKVKRGDAEEKRPIRVIQVPTDDQDESYSLFYVNSHWYVFLRLHQILVERLGKMFDTAVQIVGEDGKHHLAEAKFPSPAVALRMRPASDVDLAAFFPTFIEMVKNLLDGNTEPNVYEDTMREMFGIHAYISYTMDKLVTNAVRQLQTLVTDDVCLKFTDLFLQSQKKGAAGGPCDTAEQRVGAEITYQKQAEKVDPEENCYKVIVYHKSFRMTMELLEGANIEENVADTTKWSAYIDSYTSQPLTGMDSKLKDLMKPVCLGRNARSGQRVFSNKPYPPELVKMFGLGQEEEEKTIDLDIDPLKLNRPKQESSKFMLSQTLAPVTPEEAEELEKQLERNSKRRSELKEQKETPEEAERLEKQLEANAKRRAEAASAAKSPYVIKENLQCKFHPHTYKMVYVVNTENHFYLKGSLKKARETHKKVSTKMNEAFGKWHQAWLEDSVTAEQIMRLDDWFMSCKNSETKVVSSNDISLAPYHPFNRYIVKSK